MNSGSRAADGLPTAGTGARRGGPPPAPAAPRAPDRPGRFEGEVAPGAPGWVFGLGQWWPIEAKPANYLMIERLVRERDEARADAECARQLLAYHGFEAAS